MGFGLVVIAFCFVLTNKLHSCSSYFSLEQFATFQTVIAAGVSYGCDFEKRFGVAVIGTMEKG